MTIRVLPPNLINQIAAGEVVERPASAIKELIENAIDAGATNIVISIEKGGKTYFSVTDNGCGMSSTELELAIQRHATSKLPTDDLLDINFLGFRGEALPSIASVSKMILTSRKADMDSGWQLSVEGGKAKKAVPVPCKIGTTIEVRNLFYATPARLKFLKSEQSEQGAIREVVDKLAMSHPQITFTFNNDLSDGRSCWQRGDCSADDAENDWEVYCDGGLHHVLYCNAAEENKPLLAGKYENCRAEGNSASICDCVARDGTLPMCKCMEENEVSFGCCSAMIAGGMSLAEAEAGGYCDD